MKNFLKSFLARVAGVLALLLVGVMLYSATTGGLATLPATLAGILITPLQSLTTSVSDGVSGFFGQLTGSGDMSERLAELEAENAALRQQVVELDKYKQENNWYSEILGLH